MSQPLLPARSPSSPTVAARTLAIDFGAAKTGLAMTSLGNSLALPLKTLQGQGSFLWKQIDLVMRDYAPSKVIIGLPLLLSGQDSEQTQKTRLFIQAFKERFPHLEVIAFDERLTSKQAERLLQERGLSRKSRASLSDETSAWILLTCYLEMESNQIKKE